jgi:purine-binding chemotaxis protein CheW
MVNVTQLSPDVPAKSARAMFVHVHVRLGSCDIAIPIHQVHRAVPYMSESLTVLPRRAGGLLGVADIDGSPVPIVALERWLPLEPCTDASVAPRLMVLQHAGNLVAVRVDAVLGVNTVGLEDVRKVHHQPDDAELFEAVVPACAHSPTLCILEVARLMLLSKAWCTQAQLAPASGASTGIDAPQGRHPGIGAQRYAVFRTGSEHWAIPAIAVERVVPVPATELVLGRNQRSWAISQWEGRKLALVDISEGRQASDGHAAAWMVLLVQGRLLLGLTVSECLQVCNLAPESIVDSPNDALLAGVALLPEGGKLKVLDVQRLFALTPEASISRQVPQPDEALAADSTEPCPYLVFDAGQRYASPVDGILGVVELSSEAKDDLHAGRSSFLAWRGRTIRLVNLPAVGKPAEQVKPMLAVIVQASAHAVEPMGIAIHRLADWLPARSARRSSMRIGAMGEFELINAKGAEDHANLVVIDLAQMAYMLA